MGPILAAILRPKERRLELGLAWRLFPHYDLVMAAPTLVLPAAPPPDLSVMLELPSELLLALHQTLDRDALDAFVLAGDEGAVQVEDVLNELVPDGAYLSIPPCAIHAEIWTAEGALSQTPLVSLLLRSKIQDLRLEVAEVRALLEEDQDPDKMSIIQELIGVRPFPCRREDTS
jgi:hypothetical protein